MEFEPLRIAYGLVGKICGELIALGGFSPPKEFVHLGIRQSDGQDAILEAIVIKDVGKARRDDHSEAVIEQRPGRVFATRTAAEIGAS